MNNIDLANDIDSIPDIECFEIIEADSFNTIVTSSYNFKVLTVNIRSIYKNFDAFLVTLRRLNSTFDVLILTECRLNDTIMIEDIPGYNQYSTKNNFNQNGGVVTYVRSSLWPVVVTEPDFGEACCLLINVANKISILGIYRSPSFKNLDNYLNSLDKTLKALENRHCIIVAGDINIDILSPESNDYLCLNSEHGLEPAITKPTRLNACLDHIFIKTKGSAVGVVYDCDITDHKLAALGLNTFRVDSYQNACKVKTKTVVDNIGLCDFLASVDWYPVTTKSDVNESVGAFLGIMGNAIELNSRKVRISRSKYIIRPWMTPGLLRCSRHKDKLHAKSKQNPKNEVLNISYRRYRNFYTDIVRKVRLAYERELLQRNSKNTKLLWKSTKDICYTKTSHPVSEKLLTITNDPKVSLNKCNEFFSSVGLNLANDILLTSNESEDGLACQVDLSNSPAQSFFMEPTDQIEVSGFINTLKADSAPANRALDEGRAGSRVAVVSRWEGHYNLAHYSDRRAPTPFSPLTWKDPISIERLVDLPC
ncbi:hypothetical protein ACJJTC_013885 [Scirpophaga incertulas]